MARPIFPIATVLIAMSSTNGRCLPAGMPTPSGLFPNVGVEPPHGARQGPPLVVQIPISPSAAAIHA